MIVDFAQETWSQVRDEALPLLQEHWDEMRYGYPLDVNFDMVEALEQAGVMRAYTARSKVDASLIGYAGFSLNRSMQSRNMMEAHDLGVFLAKEYRHGGLAQLLLDYADEALVKDGADLIFYHSPAVNPAFSRLLDARGFNKVDEVYARRVSCQQA